MLGPVEFITAHYRAEQFTAELAGAVADLVDRGIIHVIDLVFVRKQADGSVVVVELEELDEQTVQAFEAVGGEYGGLIGEEDIAAAAADLEPDATEVLVIWENLWARDFLDILRQAGGEIIEHARIPGAVAEEAFAAVADA